MRRIALPVVLAAAALAALGGCSKTDSASSTTTVPASLQAGGGDTPTVPGNITVPGGGDVDKLVQDAQKCGTQAAGYAGLYTPLMGGSATAADKEKVSKALAELKANAPDKIKSDLDTIANGIKNASTSAELATFMTSDAYTKANDEVTQYLAAGCSNVGK